MEYTAKDGNVYRLVRSSVILRGGKETAIYYFIGVNQPLKPFAEYANELPDGYEIDESKVKPLIRKKR